MTDDIATIRDGIDSDSGDLTTQDKAHAALDRVEARLANYEEDANFVRAEALQAELGSMEDRADTLERERDERRIEADHCHDDYEDAEDIIRQIAEKRPNRPFDPWAVGLCQAFLDRPNRSRTTVAGVRAEADRLREALAEWVRRLEEVGQEVPHIARAALGPQTEEQT